MPGWLLCLTSEGGRGTTQLLARLLQWAQASSFGYPLALFERSRGTERGSRGSLRSPSYVRVRKPHGAPSSRSMAVVGPVRSSHSSGTMKSVMGLDQSLSYSGRCSFRDLPLGSTVFDP